MSAQTRANKTISLRIPENLLILLRKKAAKQGRSLSNYLKNLITREMDTTEYLLSSPANVESLERALKQVKEGKVKSFQDTQELLEYVQNNTNRTSVG